MTIKDMEKRIARNFPGLGPIPISEEPEANRTVMQWITAMDDKVCLKYCQPLDGKQWELDDGRMPMPPDSTHPNCRCYLEIVEIPREQQELVTSEEASLISIVSLIERL